MAPVQEASTIQAAFLHPVLSHHPPSAWANVHHAPSVSLADTRPRTSGLSGFMAGFLLDMAAKSSMIATQLLLTSANGRETIDGGLCGYATLPQDLRGGDVRGAGAEDTHFCETNPIIRFSRPIVRIAERDEPKQRQSPAGAVRSPAERANVRNKTNFACFGRAMRVWTGGRAGLPGLAAMRRND